MLNSGDSKKGLAKKLEVNVMALDRYIIDNNLTYTTPSRNKNAQKVKYNNKDVVNDDPLGPRVGNVRKWQSCSVVLDLPQFLLK